MKGGNQTRLESQLALALFWYHFQNDTNEALKVCSTAISCAQGEELTLTAQELLTELKAYKELWESVEEESEEDYYFEDVKKS